MVLQNYKIFPENNGLQGEIGIFAKIKGIILRDMKRIYFIIITLSLAAAPVWAQDSKSMMYRGTVELDVGCAPAFEWFYYWSLVSTTHGVEINNSLTVSAGFGLGPALVERNDHATPSEIGVTLSAFCNIDYAFRKGAAKRPFIALKGGYFGSVGLVGPSWSVGGGIRIKERWNLALFYRQIFVNDEEYKGLVHFPSLNIAYRF